MLGRRRRRCANAKPTLSNGSCVIGTLWLHQWGPTQTAAPCKVSPVVDQHGILVICRQEKSRFAKAAITRQSTSAVLMLGQRPRRWANIETALVQYLVFARESTRWGVYNHIRLIEVRENSRQIIPAYRYIEIAKSLNYTMEWKIYEAQSWSSRAPRDSK